MWADLKFATNKVQGSKSVQLDWEIVNDRLDLDR